MDAKYTLVDSDLVTELNEGKKVASKVGATIPGIGKDDFKKFVYELFKRVVEGELQPDKAEVGLNCTGPLPEGTTDVLCDVLWLLSEQVGEPAPVGGEAGPLERLVQLTGSLQKAELVTRRHLMETQNREFLEQTGCVTSADAWHKREIRFGTKMAYTQHKFNLAREDSEGYAKAFVLLCAAGPAALTEKRVPAVRAELSSLMGYFDLDPTRMADLVLEAFAGQPDLSAYLQLMDMFSANAVVHTLGFKFRHRVDDREATAKLCLVAAQLIQAGLVDLKGLLGHLSPADAELKASYAEARKEMASAVSRIGAVNLAAPKGQGGAGGSSSELIRRAKQRSAEAIDLDARPHASAMSSRLSAQNQKLALLQGVLAVGDWATAKTLLSHFSSLGVDTVVHEGVCAALCELLEQKLAPVTAAAAPRGVASAPALPPSAVLGSTEPTSSRSRSKAKKEPVGVPPPIPPEAYEILTALGPYLYRQPRLFVAACRSLRLQLARHATRAPGGGLQLDAPDVIAIVDALQACVLQAAMLFPANPAMAFELWELLSMLPYTARYRLYSRLPKINEEPILKAANKKGLTTAKQLIKRLSVPQDRRDRKEALKPFGRVLAMATHATPHVVADWLIEYCESYSNWIEPLVDALLYLGPYALDAMSYAIVTRISDPRRPKLNQEDGVNLSQWLVNLATFTGFVAKKYPTLELNMLLQYVAHTLRQTDPHDIVLLEAVVGKMTGIYSISDVSDTQVEALSGSDALALQALSLGDIRSLRSVERGQRRLVAALTAGPPRQQLLLPLLILLVQQRAIVAIETDSAHVKDVAALYDRTQSAVLQFCEFLSRALPPEKYKAVLPPLPTLVEEYGFPPEIAFHLYRPILRAIRTSQPVPGAKSDGDIAMSDADKDADKDKAKGGALQEMKTWADVITAARCCRPDYVWNSINPALYAVFWTHRLRDLHCPTEKYNATITELRHLQRREDDKIGVFKANMGQMVDVGGSQRVATEDEVQHAKKERTRLQELADRLPGDRDRQSKEVAAAQARLDAEKDTLQAGIALKDYMQTIYLFVQECIIPRCTLTPVDAVYCGRFIERIQEMRMPGISMLVCLDKVVQCLAAMTSCMTDREAQNFGFFYLEILNIATRWMDPEVFAKVCKNTPGFLVEHIKVNMSENDAYCSFKYWVQLFNKWQGTISSVFSGNLRSGEYVAVRNSLLVLNKIVKVYPSKWAPAQRLLMCIEEMIPILRKKGYEDLALLGTRFESSLRIAMYSDSRGRFKEDAVEKEKASRLIARERENERSSAEKKEKKAAPTAAKPAEPAAPSDPPPKPSLRPGRPAAKAAPKPSLRPEAAAFEPSAGSKRPREEGKEPGKETPNRSDRKDGAPAAPKRSLPPAPRERESGEVKDGDDKGREDGELPDANERGGPTKRKRLDDAGRSDRAPAGASTRESKEDREDKEKDKDREKEKDKDKEKGREKDKEKGRDSKDKDKEKSREPKEKEKGRERGERGRDADRGDKEKDSHRRRDAREEKDEKAEEPAPERRTDKGKEAASEDGPDAKGAGRKERKKDAPRSRPSSPEHKRSRRSDTKPAEAKEDADKKEEAPAKRLPPRPRSRAKR